MEAWFNRIFLGYFSFMFYLLAVCSFLLGITHLFGLDKEIGGLLLFAGFVVAVILTVKTYRFQKRKDYGELSRDELAKYYKLRRIVWAYLGAFIGLLIFVQNDPDLFKDIEMDGEFAVPLIVIGPGIFATFLVIGIPIIYRRVADYFKNRKKKSVTTAASTISKKSWFLDKIIVPVVTGVITGLIGMLFTGQFHFGSSITLLTIPIAWILNLKVSIDAEA